MGLWDHNYSGLFLLLYICDFHPHTDMVCGASKAEQTTSIWSKQKKISQIKFPSLFKIKFWCFTAVELNCPNYVVALCLSYDREIDID